LSFGITHCCLFTTYFTIYSLCVLWSGPSLDPQPV
jgi:hypothetical protein